MKQVLLAAIASITLLSSTLAGQPTLKEKHTFVLVHGAWMAPYAWKTVKELLEKDGQLVIVVELPGHGSDQTPPQLLSIDVYKETVIKAINTTKGKVILVGHSLAGMVISAVAEQIPGKIDKLIFVGAYVPASGQSLLDLANKDAGSHLGPNLIPSADKLTLDVKHENIIDIFCADSKPEIQQMVMDNFRVEPAIPFTNPVTITAANFGKVNKYYIHTKKDHVIGIELQNSMVVAASIKHIYSLDSSHTPFLSMPDQLTTLLLSIAN